MRLCLIILSLFLAGCAATEPEGSIALEELGKSSITLQRLDSRSFEGCADILLKSNVPGFQVNAKVVDRGELALRAGGQWSVSLMPTGEDARYEGRRSRLTLAAAHPKGQEKPLTVCVQVTNVDPKSHPYNAGPMRHPADVYVTVCPPMNP